LGKGEHIDKILSDMVMMAEGVPTVKAIHESAKKLEISMPIIDGIYAVIYQNADVKSIVGELMRRTAKEEFYERKE
jgi:glycerol-3-phosphate dehydrogenase (NAD(P)+)